MAHYSELLLSNIFVKCIFDSATIIQTTCTYAAMWLKDEMANLMKCQMTKRKKKEDKGYMHLFLVIDYALLSILLYISTKNITLIFPNFPAYRSSRGKCIENMSHGQIWWVLFWWRGSVLTL